MYQNSDNAKVKHPQALQLTENDQEAIEEIMIETFEVEDNVVNEKDDKEIGEFMDEVKQEVNEHHPLLGKIEYICFMHL